MTDEAGTVSPDLRIRQLEEDLLKEKDRLDKLYTGYMELQKEAEEKTAVIDVLEKEAIDKEIELEGLDSLLSGKDSRIRGLELDGAKSGKRVEHLEPELEKMEEMYTRESARLGRVFEVAEDLDEALRVAKAELSTRDDWYVQHMQVFEDLNEAIKTRYDMIDSAIEAIREQELKQATFRERMDEALEAAAESEEEADDDDDDDSDDE
jgi:chromosome segregation ATPase